MVMVDTGFWLALINREDANRSQARKVLIRIQNPLVTTWPVVTETCYLLLKRVGNHAQAQFMEDVAARKFHVFETPVNQALRISKLMKQYADLPMDLADASLIILAEYLGHGRILSADQRDFNTYRWKNREPFENLMFPT